MLHEFLENPEGMFLATFMLKDDYNYWLDKYSFHETKYIFNILK